MNSFSSASRCPTISGPSVADRSFPTLARSWSRHKTAILVASACACSVLAWSGRSLWLLPLSLILPYALGQCQKRASALCVAAAYFGSALAPSIHGAQVFFKQPTPLSGVLLWLLWTSSLAALFALSWHRRIVVRTGLIGVALLVHTFLPIGLASPLTSAGVLFPDTGFFGCLFALVLCLALSAQCWKLAGSLVLAALLWQVRSLPPAPIPNWRAVNSSLGGESYRSLNEAASFQALMWISAYAKTSPGQVHIFPEDVLPGYSDAVTGEWIDLATIARQGTTIVVGSDRPTGSFRRRENVLLARGALSGEYVQRVPVPVAMWGRDTDAHLWAPGTVKIGAHRAAVLLCYEQLLVLPVLQSFAARPDVLLASSNLYWASDTNVNAVEEVCVESWARLFHVPYLRAVNR